MQIVSAVKMKGEVVVVNPIDTGMLEGGLKPITEKGNNVDGRGGGGDVGDELCLSACQCITALL